MYYFFNRGLDAVLTTKGWVEIDQLSTTPASLLGFEKKQNPPSVLQGLVAKCGKKYTKHTALLKEASLANNRPVPIAVQATQKKMLLDHWQPLVQYLLNSKENVQKTDSKRLFPLKTPPKVVPSTVEPPIFTPPPAPINLAPPPTPVQQPVTPKETPPLPFPQERQIEHLIDEETILALKSNLKVENYELSKNILSATASLTRIYQQTEEISTYYKVLLQRLDAQIEDELHYIEFTPLDPVSSDKIVRHLQDLRLKRRFIKDSIYMASMLTKGNGKEFTQQLTQISEKIQQLDQRKYLVRAPDDFQH